MRATLRARRASGSLDGLPWRGAVTRRLKVFWDGGCRPNPGPIEAAVVLRGCAHHFADLGMGSNTDAEWQALLCAVRLMQDLRLRDVELIGDSREVVEQAKLVLATGRASGSHAATFLALAVQNPPARIRWIKREQNLAGIALDARRR